MQSSGIHPIESDMNMVQACLEKYTTAAQMVGMEQVILKEVEETRARTSEVKFYNQIAARRMQDLNSGPVNQFGKVRSTKLAASGW